MKRVFLISDLRECKKCKKEKPLQDFTKNSRLPSGYTNECKECHNAYLKNRRDGNPEVYEKIKAQGARWRSDNPDADRRKYLFRKFNITLEEYQDMLDKQGGVCGICGKEETVVRRSKSGKEMLAVDHCHTTGKIRGLLCFRCNTALGALGDSLEEIQRVVDYLKKASQDA